MPWLISAAHRSWASWHDDDLLADEFVPADSAAAGRHNLPLLSPPSRFAGRSSLVGIRVRLALKHVAIRSSSLAKSSKVDRWQSGAAAGAGVEGGGVVGSMTSSC